MYPTGLSEVVQGKWHQFQGGLLEVEDEADIAWLKKHKFFNQTPGVPGSFWVYVAPRDLEKELAAKEAELVEARKIIEEAGKAKAKPATISGTPVSTSPVK